MRLRERGRKGGRIWRSKVERDEGKEEVKEKTGLEIYREEGREKEERMRETEGERAG